MITRIPSGLLFPRIQSQQTSLSSALQRATDGLSSGLRVGVVRDEPTDVAIRSALQRDIRLVTAAITNVSNGVSTVALADAGLAQISSLLEKMSELAETVVNNSLTSTQRTALQTEFTQLGSQIQTISQQTSFNGINLLSGSANVILQVGIGGDANSSISVSGVQATLQAIGLGNATSGQLIYSINANSNDVAVRNAAQTAMAAVQAAIDQVNNSRTTIQASESRLEGSIKSLSVARENIEAAVNQIDDVDATSAQLRASINREATSALLAQANMEPLNVSRLIDTPDEVDSPKSEVRPSSSVELFSGSTLQQESTQLQTIKEGLAKRKKDS